MAKTLQTTMRRLFETQDLNYIAAESVSFKDFQLFIESRLPRTSTLASARLAATEPVPAGEVA